MDRHERGLPPLCTLPSMTKPRFKPTGVRSLPATPKFQPAKSFVARQNVYDDGDAGPDEDLPDFSPQDFEAAHPKPERAEASESKSALDAFEVDVTEEGLGSADAAVCA